MEQRTCAECGSAFDPANGARKFCSARCRERAKYAAKIEREGVLCAGTCGRLLLGNGRSSLPVGRRMCHRCRREVRERTGQAAPAPRTCVGCGTEFTPARRGRVIYCSASCREVNKPNRATLNTRRWRVLRALVIAEESDCWICGAPVSKTLKAPHPASASGDHVIPLAEGGAPFARENVRLTHLICNTRRGAKYAAARSRRTRRFAKVA